jgi:hypothetical protein
MNSLKNNYSESNKEPDFYKKPERYTPKPWLLQRDYEILYLYRNFLFNERFNDKINLDYETHHNEKISDEAFNLYPEIPNKLNFWKLVKFRKAIKHFIIYQHSLKAPTFAERKILKEAKNDVVYIYEKTQHNIIWCLSIFAILLFRNKFTAGLITISSYLNYNHNYLGDFLFMLNSNELLMKYQINQYYKLGKETYEFIKFLEGTYNEGTNINPKQIHNKHPKRDIKYYEKFFVNDIYDLKFEKDDELIDYLCSPKSNYDFHQEYLRKLESQNTLKLKI